MLFTGLVIWRDRGELKALCDLSTDSAYTILCYPFILSKFVPFVFVCFTLIPIIWPKPCALTGVKYSGTFLLPNIPPSPSLTVKHFNVLLTPHTFVGFSCEI